ncbi:MAG: glycosyltransferase family 2 protein [Clostridia bacterium]|nr:glycosyltransferase family 2 protein [Clostridia bacterium]
MADKRRAATLQVLAVTMNMPEGDSLFKRMNLSSDALVGNQCGANGYKEYVFNGHTVKVYSRDDRGVGLNRNDIIMRADADILLFADDDVIYDDGYEEKILDEFRKHPEADAITFNVVPIPDTIPPDLNTKWKRIRWYNCLKYGAPRLAIRKSVLREKGIYFSLLFGGGAKYSSGEDSLFIADLIRSGVKVYGAPVKIGSVTFEESSWFSGYNDKYFMDKGLFFYFLSHRFSKLLCLQYCVRKKGLFAGKYTAKQAYILMKSGIRKYKNGEY